MTLVLRHPLSSAIVLAALAATAAVFTFFRPEFHPKGEGSEIKLDLSKYPPAANGWLWEDGQPGFRFGDEEDKWNISQVKPAELVPVGNAARRFGVAPNSIRVIDAIRLGPRDLNLLVAGTNAADDTCLGFATPSKTSFYCPPRLGRKSAFLLVTTRGPFENSGQTMYPTFLTGIARSDVTRVVVDQSEEWRNGAIYNRKLGSPWGTFGLSLSNGKGIDVIVYRKGGAPQRVHLDESTPGDRLIQISG